MTGMTENTVTVLDEVRAYIDELLVAKAVAEAELEFEKAARLKAEAALREIKRRLEIRTGNAELDGSRLLIDLYELVRAALSQDKEGER